MQEHENFKRYNVYRNFKKKNARPNDLESKLYVTFKDTWVKTFDRWIGLENLSTRFY